MSRFIFQHPNHCLKSEGGTHESECPILLSMNSHISYFTQIMFCDRLYQKYKIDLILNLHIFRCRK